MSFFRKLFGKRGRRSSAEHFDAVMKLHGSDIKYVTEYINGNEDVVGRGGHVTVKDGVLIIDTSGDRLFMCEVENVGVNHLLSGNGVVISGANILQNGNARVLTVHFVYYRK